MTENRPRQCFTILEGQCAEGGYIPSLVTEGQPGHSPLRGDPAKFQAPWYWGRTLAEARRICDERNARQFGLAPQDALDIVLSSMSASR